MIHLKENGNPEIIQNILSQIPELTDAISLERLIQQAVRSSVFLVAYENEKPVGCKIGYDRFHDGSFYSWLGGVLPEYRRKGIATKLNSEMEKIAQKKGYHSIVLKTRNKFKAMLLFALKNGYNIIAFEEKEPISENRIILKKEL